MELKSTISDTWKLCTFGGLVGCFFLILFLNQSHHLSLSAARNIMVELAPSSHPDFASQTAMIENPESKPQPEPKPSNSLTTIPLTTIASNLESKFETKPSNSTMDSNSPTNNNIINSPKPKLELEPSNSTTGFLTTMFKGGKVSELELKHKPEPTLDHPVDKANSTINPMKTPINKRGKKCNIFDGRWVYSEEIVPSYNTSVCPFLEEKMSCRKNGRPDSDYERWIWEGRGCDIPLFNAKDMLERLRNKRMIVVGDSLNRNQWESLACLIYSSIHPSRAMVDAEGPVYKVLKAKDYNFTLEFYWSPFLIEMDESHKSGRKVLMLDKMSSSSMQWRGADVMVFNSGHWWTHHGKTKAWDLFEYDGQLVEEMPIELAYERAMKTWAKWVRTNVNPKKTTIFFRSISTEHKGEHWCYNSTQPIIDDSYTSLFPKLLIEIIERQIEEMNKKKRVVKYLNITKLSGHRQDAHPSIYRSSTWKIYIQKYKRLIPSYADCSHWCLPGLPDTWNRLLYASLFFDTQADLSIS